MDEKSGAGPVPPYEANPGVQHQNTGHNNFQPVHNPSAPAQYPHQPIPPQGVPQQQYIHTPAGSPPPHMGSPGGAGPFPPPQQQQHVQQPQHPQQHMQIHQASPVVSPGQEKAEYYAHPGAHPATQQGVPQGQPILTPGQQGTQYMTAIPLASLQRTPAPVDCPNCRQRSMTRVEYHSGNYTHVWALVLFCLLCACCVPYLMKGTKDVEHKCGHCGTILACYHASGHTEVLSYA